MVKCSFCGKSIESGTGKMYVFVSGKIDHFCSMKCEKNQLKLKRKPVKMKWTEEFKKRVKKNKIEVKKE